MASNRRATLTFPAEIMPAPWEPGGEVEGSLVLSTPSFPSEKSCKLQPSTIRGIVLKEERKMQPRRASEPLVSPTTRANIDKWLMDQENAKSDCDHMADAKACGVVSTRPDAAPVLPLHNAALNIQCIQDYTVAHQLKFPDNVFMAPERGAQETQIAIQADRIRELEHHNKIQKQKIAELEEGKEDLAYNTMASNQRILLVKSLSSFEKLPDPGQRPMDHIWHTAKSCVGAIQSLEGWLDEGTNWEDIHDQFPELASVLGHLHENVGDVLAELHGLIKDCNQVYGIANASDSEMVAMSKERYADYVVCLRELEDSEVDKEIQQKYPGLHME